MSSNRLRTVAQRAAVPSRIFKVDVGVCSKCGGEMEIMSAVFDEFQVRRYLEHVELARDPPSNCNYPQLRYSLYWTSFQEQVI